ncbi:MAG: 4'-phosphopantetheinyl transferase superfamily protein [Desulfobulbaceae bacterium]|nr:4'-phosphopantetheinyl transferase superfamily protein [Desulfobulbaceae bacterium]
MFAFSELILPFRPSALAATLGLPEEPELRRVDLTVLQTLLDTSRMNPDSFLTPAEQATWAGLIFPKRRQEWLGGRLAAKAAALAGSGQTITAAGLAQWQVSSSPDGRPVLGRLGALPGESAAELSISHSHGLAAALVVTARPCGLDLQKVTDTVVRVRERFCTESEGDLLRRGGAGGEREEVRLSLLWAAKEALRKGRGGVPLTGFLAMQLAGIDRIGELAWCFRLTVAGVGEYQVVVFLFDDFAGAVSVR